MLTLPILVCLLVPVMMEGSLYMIPETPQQVIAGPTNPSVFPVPVMMEGSLYMILETTADKCQPYVTGGFLLCREP